MYLKPGARVTVHVKDVPREAVLVPGIVLFSLLQHEHKITVLNFTVQRNTEYDGSVRSKVTFPILILTSSILSYPGTPGSLCWSATIIGESDL